MIQKILQIFGFLIIITSIIIGFNLKVDEEKIIRVFFVWVGLGLTSGLILIGIGEIIHQQIKIIGLLKQKDKI